MNGEMNAGEESQVTQRHRRKQISLSTVDIVRD